VLHAAAGRTRCLRLSTGVSLIPLHHPLRLAEEYAMLDVLGNGVWNMASAAASQDSTPRLLAEPFRRPAGWQDSAATS
jgi:alkanesulfonate monooxygenase SsuD/methylene tetrahydromethanopterin reductase-like flavin-dependent oxidoreductase (luciferase family)